MANAKVIGQIQVNNESGQILDPDTHVKIIDVNGEARLAGYGDFIYEGEQLYCDNEDVTLQVKYTALEDATVYEGVFRVLADGSVIAGIDGNENLFGDDINFMDTAAGDGAGPGSSAFLEEVSSSETSLELLDMNRGVDDTGYGLGITDFGFEVNTTDQTPPVINSTNSVIYDENDTSIVLQVTASDTSATTFSIEDGLDADLFSIDPISGEITFNDSPDFETPLDLGGDNEYNINVTARDALGNFTTQLISINVNNVNEAPGAIDDSLGFGEDVVYENGTLELDILANDTDVDAGDSHKEGTFTIDSLDGEHHRAFTVNGGEDALVFTPGEDFDYLGDGEHKDLVVSYTMSDDGVPPLTDTATVTLRVTGTNDKPEIHKVDVKGKIIETGDQADDAADLNETGSITFTDVDLTDRPTATETTKSLKAFRSDGERFTLEDAQKDAIENSFTIAADKENANDGTINWDYTIAESTIDFLAAGEKVTVKFKIIVTDDEGAKDTQVVTIKIVGTNDTPEIQVVNVEGDIVEGSVLTDSGSITFTDVDLSDRPEATISNVDITATQQSVDLGIPSSLAIKGRVLDLTDDQKEDIEEAFKLGNDREELEDIFTISPLTINTNNGTVNWNYNITESELDFLAQGDKVTAVFTITVSDGNGGNVDQDVTVTIHGTNDSPIISEVLEGKTEASEAGNKDDGTVIDAIQATGSVASTDVDNNSTATYSGDSTGTYGSIAVDADTGVWTYTVDATAGSAADMLNEDDIVSDKFTITVTDDKGATDTVEVTVTVNGTNDSPTVVNEDNISRGEDQGWIGLNVLNNDSDIDSNDTNKNMEISAFSAEFISTTSGLNEKDFNLNNVLKYVDKNDNKLDMLKFKANGSFDNLELK